MNRAVIALSGGMDSTCLLTEAFANGVDEIVAVSFDYGQRHKFELEKAAESVSYLQHKGYCITHKVVDLSSVGALLDSALTNTKDVPEGHYEDETMKDTVVPNRNIIFSSILYGVALSIANKTGTMVTIGLGMHAGDNAIYPDCRPESVEMAQKTFAISNWGSENVVYATPYVKTDKEGILRSTMFNCKKLGLDFDTLLRLTSTTYKPTPDGKSEGRSSSDIERIEAFIKIGRKDPIEYTKPWEEIVSHAKGVLLK